MLVPQEKFRQALEQFYQQMTKNSTTKYALKNKLKILFSNIRKEWLIPQVTVSLKRMSSLKPDKANSELEDSKSIRLTASRNDGNLTVSKSRSQLSQMSKGSGQALSENQSKLFNCEWMYVSEVSSRTLLYAIMSAFILTQNKLFFKMLQDRINDQLSETDQFSQLQLGAIGNHWQKMGGLLARSKTVRWQKLLKEAIDRFPVKFTKLACCVMLQFKEDKHFITDETIEKLSKSFEVRSYFFTIAHRQIDHATLLGSKGPQIFVGRLTHSNKYVISNQAPQYGQQQKNLRKMKLIFQTVTSSLTKQMNSNSLSLLQYKNLTKNTTDKDETIREHFKNKLEGLQTS